MSEKRPAHLTVGELIVRLSRYDPSLEVWLEVENGPSRPATLTTRCQPIDPPGPLHVTIEAYEKMVFLEIPSKCDCGPQDPDCGDHGCDGWGWSDTDDIDD
jgi:hypothetical protein